MILHCDGIDHFEEFFTRKTFFHTQLGFENFFRDWVFITYDHGLFTPFFLVRLLWLRILHRNAPIGSGCVSCRLADYRTSIGVVFSSGYEVLTVLVLHFRYLICDGACSFIAVHSVVASKHTIFRKGICSGDGDEGGSADLDDFSCAETLIFFTSAFTLYSLIKRIGLHTTPVCAEAVSVTG